MKHLLLTTIAAVVLVGCGESQQSPTDMSEISKLSSMTAKISIDKAAFVGNIEAVKQHLAAGTDVNLGGGATPLHPATYSGHKEVVELLIGNGANVNAKSKGWTPLDIAIEFEHTEIADLLRKHGGKTGEELKAEGK